MLTGAHRTGKSTLAQAFSEKTGTPFVRTGASQVFQEMGLDPKVDYPMEVRLEIQKRILEAFDRQCRQQSSGLFITDRTPLDFAAYTLADCQRSNVPDSLHKTVEKYVDDCIDVANRNFSVMVIVQPGIPLVEDPTKAPANIPYVEHISHLIMGMLVSERIRADHFYIPRYMTNLDDRVSCVEAAIARTHEKLKEYQSMMEKRGNPVLFH